MHRFVTALLALVILAASHVTLAFELPGPLVDTDWLEQHLDDVTILDVRNDLESFTRKAILVRKRFTGDLRLRRSGAHIPGAVLVDFLNIRTSREINDRNVRYMTPAPAEFQTLMREWGINRDDAIVITHQGTRNNDVTLATRLYWQIKYFGHDNVALLDGGVAAWLLEEKPASIEASEPAPGNWEAGEGRASLLASSDDVARASAAGDTELVDTRSLGYYLGAIKLSSVRKKGHIPGARIFPNELLTAPGAPAWFNDSEALQRMADELAIDSAAPIITYCNTGQLASLSWFFFSELLKKPNVRLYDGSMHEWVLEKRPVETTLWKR